MNVEVNSPIEQKWKPHKKQQEFISIPFDVEEALYGGAAGGGKSELLVMLPLIYGFHNHDLFKGIILRRTNPELEGEIIGRAHQWYPHTGARWFESKKKYVWPDKFGEYKGAEMRFGHAELEKDIRKYDGVQYNYVAFDEATSFTEFQYLYLILTRRRSATIDLPAIGRSATNPGNVGHMFQRGRFVDPYPFGGRILKDKLTGIRRFYLQCLGTDNPHLIKANPRYFDNMRGMPEAEYRAKALGDWYTFSGQVFIEFRLEPLDGEPPNAQHVIEGFEIPSWWPRIIAIDWGFAANTVIGWGAIAPNGRVYVYRIFCEKQQYIKDWIGKLISLTTQEEFNMLRDIVICHSANQQRGEPHTILQQVQAELRSELGYEAPAVRLGKRDRLGGKMLLHEYLRWKPKPTQPVPIEQYDSDFADKILRQYGTAKYHEYLSFFQEQPPEANLPKLQIFENSPEGTSNAPLYDCIPLCMYEEKGEKGTVPEDVKEFDGDDPYDMIRMLLESVDRYVTESSRETENRAQRDKVLSEYASSGNATQFYRNMERLEKQGSGIRGVRRFHRRRR
jgi:hypothetical protein